MLFLYIMHHRSGVFHIRGRAENHLALLASLGPFDAYVCDMNVELPATVSFLKNMLPFLSADAVVVGLRLSLIT